MQSGNLSRTDLPSEADMILELEMALCYGAPHELKANFTAVLQKYGMPTDKIDVLMRTPLRHIAKALVQARRRKLSAPSVSTPLLR